MTKMTYVAMIVVMNCLGAAACSKDPEVAKREYVQSGDRYASEKKFKEAAIEYRNAIQQDPRFGEARFKLAETNAKLGDLKGAYGEYIRAADLLPSDINAQVKAAQMLLLARQFEDSKTRAEKALAIDANNVDALIVKGNALAGLKNLDAAVADVEAAIQQDPARVTSYANLGRLEAARGNQDAAENSFKKAVEADPKSVPARLGLANFYWMAKRLDEAERELKAALALEPKNVAANKALAIFYVGANRAAEAEPFLKTAAEVSPDGSARFALADYYIATRRGGEAKKLLEDLSNSDPNYFARAKVRLASLAVQAGDRPGAAKLIDEVLEKHPTDVDALVAKSDLLLGDGKRDDALAAAKGAVVANARNPRAQYQLGKVYVAREEWAEAVTPFDEAVKLQPTFMTARVALARTFLAQRKADDALSQLTEVLKAVPQHGEAQMLFARALMTKGDAGGAEPRMRQLAASFPKSAGVQSQLGQVYMMKGDMTAARAAFDRALALDSNNMEAVAGLTSLDVAAKNVAPAKARIESRIAGNPKNVRLQMLAARFYAGTGDMAASEAALRKVLDIDPSHFEVYGALGQLYAAQRRLDDARREFEKLAQARPQSAVASYTLIGIIDQLQNKTADARASYEKVISLDSRAAVAANNLAWIYAEEGGNLDIALQLAQTAKGQMPERPEVNDTLGWVYYKKGLAALAVPPLRESVEGDPKNPAYHYHLGLAYAKAGDNAKARAALQQALTLKPDFEGAADAKQLLASLPK